MTRNPVALVLTGTLLMATVLGFGAPQAGNTLEGALARMDETSAKFKGLTANIHRVSHTDVVDTNDVEDGTIAVKKIKPGDTRVKISMTSPATKFYAIGDGVARLFNPKSEEAQEAKLGKSKDIVNQFMLLAFGSNSKELQAAYTLKFGGPDTVNGEKTTRIELTPKSEEVLKHVKRCDMWISEKGLAVQQKFVTGPKDFVLTTYSNMTMVPNLPDSAVKLDFPKGIKVTKLQ